MRPFKKSFRWHHLFGMLCLVACAKEPDTLPQQWEQLGKELQQQVKQQLKVLEQQPSAMNERPEVKIVTAPRQLMGVVTLQAPGTLRAEGVPVRGQILNYQWRVGKATLPWKMPETWLQEATGQRLDYTFAQPGVYRLQLTVNNLLNPQELSSAVVNVVVR